MHEAFSQEKRLFSAIQAYIDLLTPLHVRAYSGAKRLYLLTSLGITLDAAGDLNQLAANLEHDNILTTPPQVVVERAIAANCQTYGLLLGKLLARRLKTRGDDDLPEDVQTAPRLSYNISTPLAAHLARVVDFPLWTSQNWPLDIQLSNLAIMTQMEYKSLADIGGKIVPWPRQDVLLQRLLRELPTLFVMASYERNSKVASLPLLSIVLIITRLLYGDLLGPKLSVTPMGPIEQRIWISDSTLAALPLPSPEFVRRAFHEPDGGLIGGAAWRYLQLISTVFAD